jgi:hypothetical protein
MVCPFTAGGVSADYNILTPQLAVREALLFSKSENTSLVAGFI